MKNNRILTIQDISCVGQCSLTVALPIISACGIECGVLPSAVLSTHTYGFTGFTCRDLTEDIPGICAHFRKEGIDFAAIYTGYLGSTTQVDYVKDMFRTLLGADGLRIVDPAMADHGKLYPAFDDAYVQAMKTLCTQADYLLPNVTEACFLTGIEYRESYDRAYVDRLLQALHTMGAKNVILTGISYAPGTTGVVVSQQGEYAYYAHELLPNSCHGTGDIYAAAFVGSLIRGKSAFEAARIAADYTVECIRGTEKEHWYGACFEPALPKLMAMLQM